MKYISCEGVDVMTGDLIADAVMDYAAVLGANARTDSVSVPSVGPDGALIRTTLLVGPASEFVVIPAPDDVLEPEDPDFIRRLRDAAGRAGDARPLDADGRPRFVGADGPSRR
ncbi:hypothetical protein JOE58_003406 [Curtobacterium luteum]|uniref:Uncharacterized protein n=1 Tax=Curtobacterium luteum TaxID=33881 RepID=A0A8H9GBG5_9MICO|nr:MULTISPECIES: hypothetical protein [Curtobacterium]MBM7804155.1 hypothetical protein [Curtobacterium luteum]NUU51040.1 hypothetical protein [Curtobacterium luteum]GGK98146.1 hypothetical protein GCM10009769_15380 [Curtobacterium luteum]